LDGCAQFGVARVAAVSIKSICFKPSFALDLAQRMEVVVDYAVLKVELDER
jgi:hypothetical protein